MTCTHPETRTIATRGYTGSVSRAENRAAHGGTCDIDECVRCGARRNVNVNGNHMEAGPWGPSREERRQVAAARRRLADRLVDALPALYIRGGGLETETRLARDGRIETSVDIDRHPLPAAWLDAAREARQAVIEAERAEEEAA